MTPERTIEVIKHNAMPIFDEKSVVGSYTLDALREAIEALKKQMPKPAKYDMDNDFVECPSCGACTTANTHPEDIKYCFRCGQAINFGEGD